MTVVDRLLRTLRSTRRRTGRADSRHTTVSLFAQALVVVGIALLAITGTDARADAEAALPDVEIGRAHV